MSAFQKYVFELAAKHKKSLEYIAVLEDLIFKLHYKLYTREELADEADEQTELFPEAGP